MYDIATMILLIIIFSSVYLLGYGIIKKTKGEIKQGVIGILIIIIISGTAFYIDSNSSPHKLLSKVELMYRNHPRSYLSGPSQRRDRLRSYNGWIIDYLAFEYLEKAIEMEPDYDDAKIKLCELYLYNKKYDDIIKYAETVSGERKEDTRLLEWEAVAYYRLGDKNKAYEKYKILQNKNAVSSDLKILFILDSMPQIE